MPRSPNQRATLLVTTIVAAAALVTLACSPAGSIRESTGHSSGLRRSAAGAGEEVTPDAGTGADKEVRPAEPDAQPPAQLDPGAATPETPGTTVAPGDGGSVEPPGTIRVARNGAWTDTVCQMMPANSFWHSRVDSLPTLEPHTPSGGGLAGFPGTDSDPDPLRLRPGLRSPSSKTITWSGSGDPMAWVRLEGNWQNDSEYTAVDTRQVGPLTFVTGGLLRHRVPTEVLLELSSTDDHALFVDSDTCTLVEYINWSRIPGVRSARKATLNDLTTNERRLSVRQGWLTAPTNAADTGRIDSPAMTAGSAPIGFDVGLLERPRTGTGASGGSAIPTSPGMVRLDEVFATPDPGDQTVDPTGRIDHAITASLPWQHITGMPHILDASTPAPFSWPATTSDGCGGTTCADGTPGSDHHIPMGSRLRLAPGRCDDKWSEPQARRIIEAMCTYGVVITDSSDGFTIATERARDGDTTKWRREAEQELAGLTLRDFELVDAGARAKVDPGALWEEARAWAGRQYGHGSQLPTGWYAGRFWNSLLDCDRVAARCTDPGFARVDSAVNGPNWYAVR